MLFAPTNLYQILCSTGIQRTKQDYFKDRTLFYSSFPINEQAQKGDWNYQLKAVYCISILDFCFSDDNEVIHKAQLKDQNNQIFYDKFTLVYFEMPKFDKSETELQTNLDKWLCYIKNLKDLQMIPQVFQGNEVFEQAFKTAKIANMNREEWQNYEYSLKTYRDNLATDRYLIQYGIKQGMEQGIEQGEYTKALAIARKLKLSGMPIDEIAQVTELSFS